MNLNFLLSPKKETNGGSSKFNDYCYGLNENLSADPSQLSSDFTSTRMSDISNIKTQCSDQLPRRRTESSSPQLRLTNNDDDNSRAPKLQSSSTPHSSRAQSSSHSVFKGKKPKNQSSSSPLRGSSSADTKPYVCPNCERSFFKLEQLKRHNRLVHLNLRPYICHTCDLSFGTKQNMQVHLTTRKHQHRLQMLNRHRRNTYGSGIDENQ